MTVVICGSCNCRQTFNYETRKCVLCNRVIERIDVVKSVIKGGG